MSKQYSGSNEAFSAMNVPQIPLGAYRTAKRCEEAEMQGRVRSEECEA